MVAIDAKLEFKRDYTPRAKRGTIAIVDAMRTRKDSLSGVSVRVINLWKNPHWFDIAWFKGLG